GGRALEGPDDVERHHGEVHRRPARASVGDLSPRARKLAAPAIGPRKRPRRAHAARRGWTVYRGACIGSPRGDASMTRYGLADSERTIPPCRIVPSVAAPIAGYIHPTPPPPTPLPPLTGGPFMLDPLALAVMLSHLSYSITLYLVQRWRVVSVRRIGIVSTWMDVAFGAAILLVTEGANSPFYVFFTFAVLAAAFRAG